MSKLVWSLVWSVAILAFAKVADAHSFVCEKTVNGQSSIEVSSYPTTLHFEFEVINNHSSSASTYTSVSDDTLAGFSFDPAAPYSVPFGGSVSDTFDVEVTSFEDCARLAATDGVDDGVLVNTFTVVWDNGQASCSASVTCVEPPPPPPPEGGATRTLGFFKTHVLALDACLDQGSIDLGFVTIDTVSEALGLLWAVPSKYTGTNDKRSPLDKARFLLGRQTLVGICNLRLFGTQPTPSDLLSDAVTALAGTDCDLIKQLAEDVDAYNNSGTAEPFPMGFDPGPATPQQALAMANDPTTPSAQSCGD